MLTGVLVDVVDVVGTFVFALSGGTVALRRRLDLFGVLVLSLAAGLGGGLLRDVLIGAIPPTALETPVYGLVCLLAAALVAVAPTGGRIDRALAEGAGRLVTAVQVLDAIGLGLFVVVGVTRALAAGLGVGAATAMGVLTAVGGGVARDLLAARTPAVLHRDVYALAAVAGAFVVAVGEVTGLPPVPLAVMGAALTTCLRLAAMLWDWRAPRPRSTGAVEPG